MTEREYFIKNAVMLYDTREKKNFDVLKTFEHFGIKHEQDTFQTADYSFKIDGKDYRGEWLAERKGSLAEIYGNVMGKDNGTADGLRNNLEEEVKRANESGVTEFLVFLQGVNNLADVKAYTNSKATKQGDRAGQHIYSTLVSWQCNNRYGFKIVCAKTQEAVAVEMLNYAYYYWRNAMKKAYGDKFLKVLQTIDKQVVM